MANEKKSKDEGVKTAPVKDLPKTDGGAKKDPAVEAKTETKPMASKEDGQGGELETLRAENEALKKQLEGLQPKPGEELGTEANAANQPLNLASRAGVADPNKVKVQSSPTGAGRSQGNYINAVNAKGERARFSKVTWSKIQNSKTGWKESKIEPKEVQELKSARNGKND